MRTFLSSAALAIATGPAMAAALQVMSTEAGKDLRVGVYAVVHKDCSTGSAPEIHVTRAPTHGVLVLQSVTLSTKHVENCPVVTAPARQVLYRPAAGFTGEDEVTFDVVDAATGTSDLHPVTIAVQAAPTKL